MYVTSPSDIEPIAIKQFPYKGKMYEVKGIAVRWLSREGKDADGNPEFGLRYFTAAPGGEIPIHNHFYVQTMYIESGTFECVMHDPETDAPVKTWTCGPGQAVHVPSMVPHSMRNVGQEEAAFLCCICNVHEGGDTL